MSLGDRYAIQVEVPLFAMHDNSEYAERAVEQIKRKGAIEVFDQIYKSGHPVVVETHIESWRDGFADTMKYVLHYRLTAVQTRNIVMPVFEFTNHQGVREWKCPACATINIIDATYCGEKHDRAVGCGRPREQTR